MKYCFKCGKFYTADKMRPKYDNRGKKIGSQCINCIKNRSPSLFKTSASSRTGYEKSG